jgi:hypothetical protein
MTSPFESISEHDRDERAIGSLCDRTAAPRGDVRALFAREFGRLAFRATVRSYLRLIATANVYAILRRRNQPQDPPNLNRWEDDGGRVRVPRTPRACPS